MALGTIVVLLAGVYVVPKVLGITWTFGMTELGRFALTWVVVATVYDMMMNTEESDAFTYTDAGVSFVGTLALRAGLRRWRG